MVHEINVLQSGSPSLKNISAMGRKLKGVSAAPGIAIAPVVQFHTNLDFIPSRTVREDEVESEVQRLDAAIRSAARSIQSVRRKMADSLSDKDSQIYDVQLNLVLDPTLKTDLVSEVRQHKANVEVALQHVISRYEAAFAEAEDPLMRDRGADIRDVGRQLLSALLNRQRTAYTADGQDYIFAADEFLPSDAGVLDREHIQGIVTAGGGKYSHGAILARSLGIPCLVGVEEVLTKVTSGTQVVLDGESGVLIIEPEEEDIQTYTQLIKAREETDRRVFEVSHAPSVTPDGTEMRLMVNAESAHDLQHVDMDMVSGIGLFRTEFAFMERRQFPAEDEQVKMYEFAMEKADGRPVTFRTLDIGGDKPLPYFRTPEERNPVLGWRGLRISLAWPDILITQVRAILRASASGHGRILLPMVTSLEEVRRCREVVEELKKDLAESEIPHDDSIEMGIMVEVPAMTHVLDQVIDDVDFISVGTNDLVQYLLAVDRDNPRVAGLYDPYHPAVLRVLRQIATAARRGGRPAAICGELAGDHLYTAILMGLGFRELSMAPVFLPRVKLMVRNLTIEQCQAWVGEAIGLPTAREVREFMVSRSKAVWDEYLGGSD